MDPGNPLSFQSRVHLEILHNYSAQSITRGFNRTFALRGTPRIIWIDAGLNIVKAGKDLVNTEMKVISNLNLKFTSSSESLYRNITQVSELLKE